ALAAMLAVAIGDVVTGPDASFVLLYALPVAFATWYASRGAGVALSFAGAVLSHLADLATRTGGLRPALVAWNVVVHLLTFLALARLLGALRDRLSDAQKLARTDALTHLANRRAFFETATLELERARRHGRPLTIAYVDCDDFKDVNDRLGHAEGDALLVVAARTLRGATRATDAVARLGGDEFGLLLPETDGPTAESLLARLRTTLLETMRRHGWSVGFSTGAVTFLHAPASVDEMMARADERMYEAKRTAKGSVRHEVAEAQAQLFERSGT
ncbi:MAG TPA: GGDEF domain-containing protein, partial [Anaeromyxobacteraceae bacterium]|nr:GGDEF domain-containing protein [Anaeromyxobacteraceae bacterium]